MFSLILDKMVAQFDVERLKFSWLKLLRYLDKVQLASLLVKELKSNSLQVMKLHFNNPIGIGAGFDVNADYVDLFSNLGFGFLEFGPITPCPQLGNDEKIQATMLLNQQSIISKSFDRNFGINYLVKNLESCKYKGIIGVHINKNIATPRDNLFDDLQYCMRKLIHVANYVSIDLPEYILENSKDMEEFLAGLKETQTTLLKREGLYLAIIIRVPLQVEVVDIERFCNYAIKYKIDGVNTAAPKIILAPVEGKLHGKLISGAAIRNQLKLVECLENQIPIIASGGIVSSDDITNRLKMGAKLVQLNSGLLLTRFKILHNFI